jgi:hypothetical protein
MFRAHRPILRRIHTAVHTTIGSVPVLFGPRARMLWLVFLIHTLKRCTVQIALKKSVRVLNCIGKAPGSYTAGGTVNRS